MSRIWDVCWVCEGQGFIISGDCPNCNATGIIQDSAESEEEE